MRKTLSDHRSVPPEAAGHPKGERSVCVILVDRANYGRLRPVMQAINAHSSLTLQLVVAGTMVLERFHRPADVVRADGFEINGELYTEVEGSVPATMAKSVGVGIVEFTTEFSRLQPTFVLVIGDRYEALSAAIAAAYMNIPLVHVQGGEVSGSIDESARHAITKFAQFHVPATARAADILLRMGERPETILTVGCPGSDIARQLDRSLTSDVINQRGNGCFVDVGEPYLLSVFHPTTTQYGAETDEVAQLLGALSELRVQTVLLWPNIDAGSDHISKMVRVFRDRHDAGSWLRTRTNFLPQDYLRVLAGAACAVGNSSSFVRDAGFFGTPVVLVGNRQDGRESAAHVVRVGAEKGEIADAVRSQLSRDRFPPSSLYGDGFVSGRVAERLAAVTPYVQKKLHYADLDVGPSPDIGIR